MNVLALILAIIAVVLFLLAHFGAATRAASIALALAFLSAAWIVQSVWADHLVHTGGPGH